MTFPHLKRSVSIETVLNAEGLSTHRSNDTASAS